MNNVKCTNVVLCGTIRISGIFYSKPTSKGIPKIWPADLYKLFYQISGEYGLWGVGGGVTDDLYFYLAQIQMANSFKFHTGDCKQRTCDRIETSWHLPLVQVQSEGKTRRLNRSIRSEMHCSSEFEVWAKNKKKRESTSVAGRTSKNKQVEFMNVKLR
jgi:hypothetical protein